MAAPRNCTSSREGCLEQQEIQMPDFEKYFSTLKRVLSEAIKDRETTSDPVKADYRDPRTDGIVFRNVPVNTTDGMFDFKFVMHADCPCSAIKDFLDRVTLENITFANGPRKGKVLGVSGRAIESFYMYYNP